MDERYQYGMFSEWSATRSSMIFGLITIFGVLSYFTPDDWPGKNHTGEITNHTGEITELFQSYR